MDIQKIQEKKKELKQKIIFLFDEFQNDTGIYISNINIGIEQVYKIGSPSYYLVKDIKIQLDI